MTESPSENSISNFKSENSNLLWLEGPVGDLNPATTFSPQRQQLVAAGSDNGTPPAWEICKLSPGGLIIILQTYKIVALLTETRETRNPGAPAIYSH